MSVRDKLATFEASRAELRDKRDEFAVYADSFADDVRAVQDTSDLAAAIDELRTAFESTRESFDDYGDTFRTDVERIRDTSELAAAIAELRQSFNDTSDAFERYVTTFEGRVSTFRSAVDEQRRAMGDTRRDFRRYAEDIRSDAAAIRNPTELLSEMDRTRESFATRRAAFDAYTDEFYGFTAAGSTGPASPERTGEADDESPVESETDEELPPPAVADVPAEGETDDGTDESAATETLDDDRENVVECLVCGEYYKAITEPHLQTHDMTIDDYRAEYGEAVPLRPGDE